MTNTPPHSQTSDSENENVSYNPPTYQDFVRTSALPRARILLGVPTLRESVAMLEYIRTADNIRLLWASALLFMVEVW